MCPVESVWLYNCAKYYNDFWMIDIFPYTFSCPKRIKFQYCTLDCHSIGTKLEQTLHNNLDILGEFANFKLYISTKPNQTCQKSLHMRQAKSKFYIYIYSSLSVLLDSGQLGQIDNSIIIIRDKRKCSVHLTRCYPCGWTQWPAIQKSIDTIQNGFEKTCSVTAPEIREYWEVRNRLSMDDGLVLLDHRIVIPPSQRQMHYVVYILHTKVKSAWRPAPMNQFIGQPVTPQSVTPEQVACVAQELP